MYLVMSCSTNIRCRQCTYKVYHCNFGESDGSLAKADLKDFL